MMNMKRVVLIFALMVAVLPLAAQNNGSILGKYKKALIIGAHPDDPEYCCGGTALMLQRYPPEGNQRCVRHYGCAPCATHASGWRVRNHQGALRRNEGGD